MLLASGSCSHLEASRIWAQVVRQTLFDIASVRTEMVDVKAATLEAAPLPLREKKITPFVDDAAKAHREFLNCFLKDGKPPTKVRQPSILLVHLACTPIQQASSNKHLGDSKAPVCRWTRNRRMRT